MPIKSNVVAALKEQCLGGLAPTSGHYNTFLGRTEALPLNEARRGISHGAGGGFEELFESDTLDSRVH